jgi:hypothetical protein
MIVDYIDSQRERFGVEPVCAVLAEAGISIAPSTYYARSKTPLTDVELDEAYMANQLRSLWQNNWGVYGARKLWHAARRAGHDIGRDQVARLMKIAGISGVLRGKHRTITTRRDDAAPAASGPGQAWLGGPNWHRPAVGGRLLLRVDVGRILLRRVRCRRVLPPDLGLAGHHD